MNRPVGVTLVAVLLLAASVLIFSRMMTARGIPRGHGIPIAASVLAIMTLVAVEALWSLRRHAFLTFVLWGLCAMLVTVLSRLATPAGAHAIRLFPSILCMGIAYAIAALYLRRAL